MLRKCCANVAQMLRKCLDAKCSKCTIYVKKIKLLCSKLKELHETAKGVKLMSFHTGFF
jgi:hypothetical protein